MLSSLTRTPASVLEMNESTNRAVAAMRTIAASFIKYSRSKAFMFSVCLLSVLSASNESQQMVLHAETEGGVLSF